MYVNTANVGLAILAAGCMTLTCSTFSCKVIVCHVPAAPALTNCFMSLVLLILDSFCVADDNVLHLSCHHSGVGLAGAW